MSTRLFITAWLQVALIAGQTWQIAHQKWLGCLVVSFLISFVWCFNISRIAVSGMAEKVIYSLGSMFGTATGLALAWWIYS